MEQANTSKKKIAILGGGLGALSAAYELTLNDDWQNHYELHLYQVGWRNGGKMSGGRGPHERIEELGLHLLLGFYHNTFRIFREVYEERDQRGLAPEAPFRTLDDALLKNNSLLFVEYLPWERQWVNWPLIVPERSGKSGEGIPTIEDNLKTIGGVLLELILGSPYLKEHGPFVQWLFDLFFSESNGSAKSKLASEGPPQPAWLDRLFQAAETELKQLGNLLNTGIHELFQWKENLLKTFDRKGLSGIEQLDQILGILGEFLKWLEKGLKEGLEKELKNNNELRRLYIIINFSIAAFKGVMKDVYDPQSHTFDFHRINHLDFRQWLADNGASELTRNSVLVQFFYNAPFNSLIDGNLQGGLIAAGTAMMFLTQGASYKGSIFNQMRAGTADTLIMPLYQVLAARGVHFHFFHKVTSLEISSANPGKIGAIEIERQIRLKDTSRPYDPVMKTASGVPAWPGEPLYDQIDPTQAEQLKALFARGESLESPWCSWNGGEKIKLEEGRDFHEVILGIPVSALGDLSGAMIHGDPDRDRAKRWNDMIHNIGSTQVMSAQLWLKPDLAGLGFDRDRWGLARENCAPNVVTYAYPVFSWLDQTQFLQIENWAENEEQPRMVAAFTNAMMDPVNMPPYSHHKFNKEQKDRVRETMRQWLWDQMGWFFPNATSAAAPAGLNWELLCSPQSSEASASMRFDDQFFEAAVNPSDRYILALPNTEQYRMTPDNSGFENMVLVGDWTQFGANFGYMEGTVLSSIIAVKSLTGRIVSSGIREPLLPGDLKI